MLRICTDLHRRVGEYHWPSLPAHSRPRPMRKLATHSDSPPSRMDMAPGSNGKNPQRIVRIHFIWVRSSARIFIACNACVGIGASCDIRTIELIWAPVNCASLVHEWLLQSGRNRVLIDAIPGAWRCRMSPTEGAPRPMSGWVIKSPPTPRATQSRITNPPN